MAGPSMKELLPERWRLNHGLLEAGQQQVMTERAGLAPVEQIKGV